MTSLRVIRKSKRLILIATSSRDGVTVFAKTPLAPDVARLVVETLGFKPKIGKTYTVGFKPN